MRNELAMNENKSVTVLTIGLEYGMTSTRWIEIAFRGRQSGSAWMPRA